MHSRIIELGNAPILPDDRMGECSVPEWFYHSIADYTDTETDRDEDLKWFLEIVAHIVDVAEDGESFTFKPNAKKKYFHRQYYAFLDKARELTGISIEAFCAETPYDIGMAIYKLNEAYQDKFSFYIYYQDKLKTIVFIYFNKFNTKQKKRSTWCSSSFVVQKEPCPYYWTRLLL